MALIADTPIGCKYVVLKLLIFNCENKKTV